MNVLYPTIKRVGSLGVFYKLTGIDEFVNDADEEDCTGLGGLDGEPNTSMPCRPIDYTTSYKVWQLADEQACREGNPTVHTRFTLCFVLAVAELMQRLICDLSHTSKILRRTRNNGRSGLVTPGATKMKIKTEKRASWSSPTVLPGFQKAKRRNC